MDYPHLSLAEHSDGKHPDGRSLNVSDTQAFRSAKAIDIGSLASKGS